MISRNSTFTNRRRSRRACTSLSPSWRGRRTSRRTWRHTRKEPSTLLQGFHATAGIRYTVDERAEQSDIYIPTFRNACAETTGAFPHCNLDASGQFAAPTWTLALDYRLDPGTLLYVTARRGFKNGGFNLNAPADSAESTFKPETVNDVEIGLKSDWHVLGAAFRTDFDAYRAQYDDAQRPVTVLINGLPAAVTENAASATIEGIELEETIIPVRDTTLSVSYAYTCSRYDKYVSPVLGNLSGLPFPFTPANKLSVSWRYRLPVAGDLGVVTLGAIYSYQSSMNAGPDFSPTNVIPGYGLVNLRLDWDNIAGGPWKASIFVTNATDKLYITKTFGEYTAFGVAVVNYGEPRIIGAQLRYEF